MLEVIEVVHLVVVIMVIMDHVISAAADVDKIRTLSTSASFFYSLDPHSQIRGNPSMFAAFAASHPQHSADNPLLRDSFAVNNRLKVKQILHKTTEWQIQLSQSEKILHSC